MKIRIAFPVAMLVMASLAFAQTGGTTGGSAGGGETTIEEVYLWKTTEGQLLHRLAVSPDRTMKEKAVERIYEAIKGGKSVTTDMLKVLEYLAYEGTFVQTRLGGVGRPTDDFPDIRRRACQLLGAFKGDVAAQDILIRVIYSNDFEPSVMAAAVVSLAQIDVKERRTETLRAINSVITRFSILMPTESLANDVLTALELIAKSDGGLKDALALDALMQISECGAYSTAIRTRANKLIDSLTGGETGK